MSDRRARLPRDLGAFDITMIGGGAMIGAGIFVFTGDAAGVEQEERFCQETWRPRGTEEKSESEALFEESSSVRIEIDRLRGDLATGVSGSGRASREA